MHLLNNSEEDGNDISADNINSIFRNNKMAKGDCDELASDGLEDFVVVAMLALSNMLGRVFQCLLLI